MLDKNKNRNKSYEEDERYTLYNMESEEEDNLYNIEEDSSRGFSGYVEEDEHDEDDDNDEDEEEYDEDEIEEDGDKRSSLPALLFKILATPVEGWKEFKRRKYTAEEVASRCFYPLVALSAISEFAMMIYTTATISEALMSALRTFIAFFFGYFTILLFGGLFLPKVCRNIVKTELGKGFIMINLSSLALFYIAINLLPMIDAALVFLPIWTIYLIYKGTKILRVPNEVESRTKIVFSFLIIGMPLLWDWVIGLVI